MHIPTTLKHKPVLVAEDYGRIDGRTAYGSDAQGLSLGLAQWNDRGKVDISAKVWRHTGEKWSRQSEELPLHRVLDLAILACRAQLYFQEEAYRFPRGYDPDHVRVQDPGKIEGNCVFTYLDAFCRPEHFAKYLPDYENLDALKEHYQRGGLGDVKVKRFLNAVLEEELAPIRERRHMWEQRIPEVYEILRKGSEVAAAAAEATLHDVRNSMRINYFEDQELINQPYEKQD